MNTDIVRVPLTERGLSAVLLQFDCPPGKTLDHEVFKGWGAGEAKGVKDLFEEIQAGESQLVIDAKGIKRVLKIVRMDIEDGYSKTLLHEKTILADGRERSLHRRPSGKMVRGESPLQALHREMNEELGLGPAGYTCGPKEVVIEEAKSKSYPGLRCEYEVHPFIIYPNSVWIKNNKDGLIRQDGDQVLHFAWCWGFNPTPK